MAKRSKRRDLAAIQAAKARKKRRNRKRKRALILILESIILALLIGVAFVMAKFDKFQNSTLDKDKIEVNEGVSLSGYMTIALFGGDSREGQLQEGTHADTIMVVAIDNDSKEIRVASIYRDTLLQQEDGTYRKANHAYFVGGATEAVSMLNKNLDLDIEDYATVDFKAMSDVVDLLGGVEIELSDAEAKMLNKYVHETADVANKKAHELNGGGTYTLDGPQAVTYARLRKLEGGDYKRTERQRIVIEKLFEKIKASDLVTMNKIIDKVFPQVSTSFDSSKILAMAPSILKYQLKDSIGFPIDKTDGIKYPKAGDVVVAQGLAENVRDLHQFLYPKKTYEEASQTVQDISAEISYLTGVTRPTQLDAEKEVENAGADTDSEGSTDGAQQQNTSEDDSEL